MEQISLMLGTILMLVAAIGTVCYVALVIAIPVCRLLDWLAGERPDEDNVRPLLRSTTRRPVWREARFAWLRGPDWSRRRPRRSPSRDQDESSR